MSVTPISYAIESTTLTLNGRVIVDTVVGDRFVLAPVNPLTYRVNGSNNSVAIGKRADGNIHTLTINVLRNSEDDVWLNQQKNAEYPVIFEGSMKENYKLGNDVRISTWALEGGSITTLPTDTRNNIEGNETATYVIEFRNAIQGK